jgi:hypothetical protein
MTQGSCPQREGCCGVSPSHQSWNLLLTCSCAWPTAPVSAPSCLHGELAGSRPVKWAELAPFTKVILPSDCVVLEALVEQLTVEGWVPRPQVSETVGGGGSNWFWKVKLARQRRRPCMCVVG